jgi:hypothetical protein
MVDTWIDKYNELTEDKMDVMLIDEFLRHLMKVLRGITLQDGHMIIVGLRGFGINRLVRIASFVCNMKYGSL